MLCVIAVAGVFVLQFVWLRNYYEVNKETFEKEVNQAMEDAVKKEFMVRCDTIEHRVLNKLLDTNQFIFKNRYSPKHKTYMLTIIDRKNLSDSSAFHTDSLTRALLPGDTAYRAKVARYFAHSIRRSELESHFVFYHTQKLGIFVKQQTDQLDFDTVRLRPILNRFLLDRGIKTRFSFYLRTNDSVFNKTNFPAQTLLAYPVITKAFITYKHSKTDHYVRALFINPSGYIVSKMGFVIAGSVFLLAVVAFSLFYLLNSLVTEKKLSAIKNDFISNITHEFKTPIASVSAAVEAMQGFDVLHDPEKTKRYLGHSKNELQRLSVLVDKVLSTALYEQKAFTIKPEEIHIDEVIQTALQNQTALAHKPVNTSYVNTSGVQTLVADRLYFEHAINNVIDNAIKYSGDVVDIRVTVSREKGHIVILVADKGIGISNADLKMVFEKFYRVPTGNQHKVKGYGLGLNYVKNIIERHGGFCSIKSEQGVGTTLILNWPV